MHITIKDARGSNLDPQEPESIDEHADDDEPSDADRATVARWLGVMCLIPASVFVFFFQNYVFAATPIRVAWLGYLVGAWGLWHLLFPRSWLAQKSVQKLIDQSKRRTDRSDN